MTFRSGGALEHAAATTVSVRSALNRFMTPRLISRAASVTIKENRRLVLVPRETPLSKIHISNMLKLAEIGVVILPAMPGFYHKPKSIDDLISHIVGKTLDQFGINNDMFNRWDKR